MSRRAVCWAAGCVDTAAQAASRFLAVSVEAVDDVRLQQAHEEGAEQRGRQAFCVITTFSREHALKGNIFSKILGCLLHRDHLVRPPPPANLSLCPVDRTH